MLKLFRKEGIQKKVLWAVAGMIIISFVFFGTYSTQVDNSSSFAGKVFGKKVSLQDFEKAYNNTRDQAIMIHGESFFKMSAYLNLENETWDRIILLQEAKRRHIKAKDSDVIDFIQSLPMFQRNGQFDNILYNDLIHYVFKRNPRDFEEGMRGQLTVMKLFEQVTSSLAINEKEIREAYRRDHEKIQISYILFPPSDYTNGISVTEDEAKSYFQSHQREFMAPPSLNIEYISFDYPAGAKDEDKKALKETIYPISQKLQNGAKLETIAKQNNVEIKESGFFSMEAPNIAMGWSYDTLEKIFHLKIGEVSDPIETANGYQFLRVKEQREALLPNFADVKTKVIDAVKTSKGLEMAKQKADEHAQKIKDAFTASSESSFRTIAEGLNLKISQTPLFNRGQYLPTIGLSREFQEAAYDLTEKDKLSATVETAKGYCILYRDNIEPVKEEEFQKAKDQYASTLINEKRNQMIINFLSDLRLRADIQNNLPKKSAQ